MSRKLLVSHLESLASPEVSIDEGLTMITQMLKKAIDDSPEARFVLLIAGGTGSGKTSQGAERLQNAFPGQTTMFPLDMFYRGISGLTILQEQQGRDISWDEPMALDLEEASRQLQRLRSGHSATIPVYDFETSERVDTNVVESRPIIIVEGLFALHDVMREHADLCIYVEVDVHGQFIRRVLRDILRKKSEPNKILLNLANTAIPLQYEHVTTTRKYAHIILKNDYRPETETARNQGVAGPQLKVASWPLLGRMAELGAEYLGTLKGYDRYFTANDRDLAATGEELRIREEADRLMLTYKGPHLGSIGERFVFTCSIEPETVKSLMKYYREAFIYVLKSRRLFLLPGVLISLDEVTLTNQRGIVVERKQVTEVRLTGRHHDGLAEVTEVIQRLGLDANRSTPASYFAIALSPSLLPLD